MSLCENAYGSSGWKTHESRSLKWHETDSVKNTWKPHAIKSNLYTRPDFKRIMQLFYFARSAYKFTDLLRVFTGKVIAPEDTETLIWKAWKNCAVILRNASLKKNFYSHSQFTLVTFYIIVILMTFPKKKKKKETKLVYRKYRNLFVCFFWIK